MRKRLPGTDSGCFLTVRLLPVLTACWISFLALTPGVAVAASQAVPVAGASSSGAMGAFVKDDSSPLLLAAAPQAQPQGQPQEQSQEQPEEAADIPEEQEEATPPGQQDNKAEAKEKSPSIRLLNTVEFRGALKNMPKWQRVVAAEQQSRTFDQDLSGLMRPASVYKQWQQIVASMSNASTMEKAKAVNTFFNRWPYKTDQMVYKVADYWATPKEFLKNSGDCEDYAITKFYALMKLGVSPDSMRIIALKDTIRNLAHAVLVVYMDGDAYILDNLTPMVLSHARYQHYAPQYSINEVYRWAHVRPKKK